MVMIFLGLVLTSGLQAESVQFKDANLKAAVEQKLGVTNPTPEDMLSLKLLYADNLGIIDLTGLEYAINLKQLRLYGNNLIDITPLQNLVNVESLTLGVNQIVDVSPLSNMNLLTNLAISGNRIHDISPLASLINLRSLNLAWNDNIADVSPILSMPNLTFVNFDGSPIGDDGTNLLIIAGLIQLEHLGVANCNIPNLNFLSGLQNLKYLALFNNSLTDIGVIANLSNLEILRLNINGITDVSALMNLQHLLSLEIQDNPLSFKAFCEQIPQIIRNNPDLKLAIDPNPYFPEYPGDLPGTTCGVDLQDLLLLASWWMQGLPTNMLKLDLAPEPRDGRIDLQDFSVVAQDWLKSMMEDDSLDDMVSIPAGTFQMGDHKNEGATDERPVHTITVNSVAMGKYEISHGLYCAFLNSALQQGLITVTNGVVYQTGSGTSYPYCDTSTISSDSHIVYNGVSFSVRTKGGRDMSNDPVVFVSWYGAVAYCNWRSQKEGLPLCYNLSGWTCDSNKKGYRLPTEAEWEHAARGGLSGKRFPWGDTITHSQANYISRTNESYDVSPTRSYHPIWNDGIMPYTAPVGSFSPNGFSLNEMTGNVWEWCNDWYSGTYYSASPNSNPKGPLTGTGRVFRGGGWYHNSYYCRVSVRPNHVPGNRYISLGFRVVLDLE